MGATGWTVGGTVERLAIERVRSETHLEPNTVHKFPPKANSGSDMSRRMKGRNAFDVSVRAVLSRPLDV